MHFAQHRLPHPKRTICHKAKATWNKARPHLQVVALATSDNRPNLRF